MFFLRLQFARASGEFDGFDSLGRDASQRAAQRTPGALSMGSSLGFAAAFPVVKNEPYTASVVTQDTTIGPDGKQTLHEALNIHMRDSSGRLRDEQLATAPDAMGGFTQARVQTIDPVSMQDIQWFRRQRHFSLEASLRPLRQTAGSASSIVPGSHKRTTRTSRPGGVRKPRGRQNRRHTCKRMSHNPDPAGKPGGEPTGDERH